MDKECKNDIGDMKRAGDRIVALKIIVEQDTFNLISAYAPQVGLAYQLKVKF